MSLIKKIFGDPNQKYLGRITPLVEKINSLEPETEKIADQDFKEKTEEFKKRLKNGEALDDILPEAFALVREASKRTLSQRHFDVQIMGAIMLHQGKIAEMKTGEGKTLASTMPIYLNALSQKGVHLITVNDYLARRDSVWMGQIYRLLGLSVGCLNHEQAFRYDPEYKKDSEEKDEIRDEFGSFKVVEDFLRPCSRKEAYQADITYGTNNEFGFDYLRDNMAYSLGQKAQRGFNYAILDEIDSVLIDEARTPLIISGRGEESTDKYYKFAQVVSSLKKDEDYELEEQAKAATFTEEGQNKIVQKLGFDPWANNDIATTHQLEAALRAKTFFQRDKDYVVREGKVIIVDEFTGRLMPGRRWSGGLHQAVEAKEGIEIQPESKTLASISFQNYFRMYGKLAGMTGTAATSAEEFDKVYGLETIIVPTNRPMIRKDFSDRIYKNLNGKFKAIVKDIKERHEKGQPVLVCNEKKKKNEYLGRLLQKEGIPHQILNAKNHEEEGEIIAQAGRSGAVTIATNMAGRGVDIVLGGNPQNAEDKEKVIKAGGLHVLGTERHEARRIDNQLRGRSGRQGDPGSSQFFVSLEDDLMRVFGGERIQHFMEVLKIPEEEPIEAKMVSRAIESAQSKVEGFNFDARKHLLEYDNVMNKQREVFYKKRDEILKKEKNPEELRSYILSLIKKHGFSEQDYKKREEQMGENMRKIEKAVCLKVFDTFWVEHLDNMSHLRDSVKLRAYGQQDPLVEYKREGHRMFQDLLSSIEYTIANAVFQAELTGKPSEPQKASEKRAPGRNDPCPCGSGKKYKKCCYPNFG